MKEIGGYIELEFRRGKSFHPDAIALNTARNCFEYVLRAKNIKRIHIPHYTCEVMLEPLNKLGVEFNYYHIDENLDMILPYDSLINENILYTNYFGIKQDYIKRMAGKVRNLIIDNSQAFYHPQVSNYDTFYSARKFFGVPDGSYLYTDTLITDEIFERDISCTRISHLIKRIETGANSAYKDFLDNDLKLYNQPIRLMSELSRIILESIDYISSKTIREKNFMYLHNVLGIKNELAIDISNLSGPMFYPFLYGQKNIRRKLLENKIYIPTLWKNVFNTTNSNDFEQYLTDNLYALPIDQRYSVGDMEHISSLIKVYL